MNEEHKSDFVAWAKYVHECEGGSGYWFLSTVLTYHIPENGLPVTMEEWV